MLSRKPKRFSLLDELGVKRSSSVRSKNSSDGPSVSIRKEGLSLLSTKPKRKKSAVDAATSILDELGVDYFIKILGWILLIPGIWGLLESLRIIQ